MLDFYLEGKLPQATYEAKQEQIAKQREELEQTAEKYKTIDSKMKESICKVMSMNCNISEIFDKASPTRKNQLLKLLISDCKLNDKVLEYKVKAPFDKFIQCENPTQWFKDPTSDIETYTNIADEVKMVKQQVLLTC